MTEGRRKHDFGIEFGFFLEIVKEEWKRKALGYGN